MGFGPSNKASSPPYTTRMVTQKSKSERSLKCNKGHFARNDEYNRHQEHLPAPSHKTGRRPRSERSLKATSRQAVGRRPDRPPHERSLSMDTARTMKDSPRNASEDQIQSTPKADRPTLTKSRCGSLRDLAGAKVSLRSLTPSGSSFRNLVSTAIFRRNDKYMDFESKSSSIFDEPADKSLSVCHASFSSVDEISRCSTVHYISIPPPPPPPPSSPSPGNVTPKLRPSKKDSAPYSSPTLRRRQSKSISSGDRPPRPIKSLSLSHIDSMVQSPIISRPAGGDAAVASMAWELCISGAKSPGKRRATKGEKLRRMLVHQEATKKAPLAEQQSQSDDYDEILIPLHFLDAKREITRKQNRHASLIAPCFDR